MSAFSDEVYDRVKMTNTDLPSRKSREFKLIVLGTLYAAEGTTIQDVIEDLEKEIL